MTGETENDGQLAEKLAQGVDVYINTDLFIVRTHRPGLLRKLLFRIKV